MKTMFPGTSALLLMLDYTITDPQEPWIALCNPCDPFSLNCLHDLHLKFLHCITLLIPFLSNLLNKLFITMKVSSMHEWS